MTVVEFIRKKNSILKEYVGLPFDLVPEEQIKEIAVSKPLSIESSSNACPYCVADIDNTCFDCPMYQASNCCHNHNSTWDKLCVYLRKKDLRAIIEKTSPVYLKLSELVDEFNTTYFHK